MTAPVQNAPRFALFQNVNCLSTGGNGLHPDYERDPLNWLLTRRNQAHAAGFTGIQLRYPFGRWPFTAQDALRGLCPPHRIGQAKWHIPEGLDFQSLYDAVRELYRLAAPLKVRWVVPFPRQTGMNDLLPEILFDQIMFDDASGRPALLAAIVERITVLDEGPRTPRAMGSSIPVEKTYLRSPIHAKRLNMPRGVSDTVYTWSVADRIASGWRRRQLEGKPTPLDAWDLPLPRDGALLRLPPRLHILVTGDCDWTDSYTEYFASICEGFTLMNPPATVRNKLGQLRTSAS